MKKFFHTFMAIVHVWTYALCPSLHAGTLVFEVQDITQQTFPFSPKLAKQCALENISTPRFLDLTKGFMATISSYDESGRLKNQQQLLHIEQGGTSNNENLSQFYIPLNEKDPFLAPLASSHIYEGAFPNEGKEPLRFRFSTDAGRKLWIFAQKEALKDVIQFVLPPSMSADYLWAETPHIPSAPIQSRLELSLEDLTQLNKLPRFVGVEEVCVRLLTPQVIRTPIVCDSPLVLSFAAGVVGNFELYSELKSLLGLKLDMPENRVIVGKKEGCRGDLLAYGGSLKVEAQTFAAPYARVFGDDGIEINGINMLAAGGNEEFQLTEVNGQLVWPQGYPEYQYLNYAMQQCKKEDVIKNAHFFKSNGTIFVSNSGINLKSSGLIVLTALTLKSTNDTNFEAGKRLNLSSINFDIGGDLTLSAEFSDVWRPVTANTNNLKGGSPLVFPVNYQYPQSQINVKGDVSFVDCPRIDFRGKLHAGGKILGPKGEKIDGSHFFFKDETTLTNLHFTETIKTEVSSGTQIDFTGMDKVSLNRTFVQTPFFQSSGHSLQIGTRDNVVTQYRNTFKPLHDLMSYQGIGMQGLYEFLNHPNYLLSPVVPLRSTLPRLPVTVVNPKPGIDYSSLRRLFPPELEVELVGLALQDSLHRGYMQLNDGMCLRTPEDLYLFGQHQALKVTDSLGLLEAPANPSQALVVNPQRLDIAQLQQMDQPMVAYEATEFVHKDGRKEMVLKPWLYLPKKYDDNVRLHNSEGGLFADLSMIDVDSMDFTGVLCGSDALLKVKDFVGGKRQHIYQQRVTDVKKKSSFFGLSSKKRHRSYRLTVHETQPDSGVIDFKGRLVTEIESGAQQGLEIKAKESGGKIDKPKILPLVDTSVTQNTSKARGSWGSRRKVTSSALIPRIVPTTYETDKPLRIHLGRLV